MTDTTDPITLAVREIGGKRAFTGNEKQEIRAILERFFGWQDIATAPDDRPILAKARREGDPTVKIVCVHRYSELRKWAIYGTGKSQDCLDIVEPLAWAELPNQGE